MKKILVADDSVTIQKVISITLAGLPYTLKAAYSEKELYKMIEDEHFDLILLDYTLSTEKSGIEFAREVVSKISKTPILLMPGVFDQVDDNLLEDIGIKHSIIKPFESSRFIKVCTEILDSNNSIEEKPIKTKKEVVPPITKDQENEFSWIMHAPEVKEDENLSKGKSDMKSAKDLESQDALASEVSDWISEIPKIDEKDLDLKAQELPPAINAQMQDSEVESSIEDIPIQTSSNESFEAAQEVMAMIDPDLKEEKIEKKGSGEIILPSEEDLAYPEIFSSVDEGIDLSSKIVSFDEMAIDSFEIQRNNGELTEKIQLPKDLGSSLESAIIDEIGDDGEDIWKLDDMPQNSEALPSAQGSVDEDALVEKIKQAIIPALEGIVKNYCETSVKKIAWEVIPDLAENIIKKEIKELSDMTDESDEE